MKRGLGILGSAFIFLPSLAAQPPAAAAQTIEIPLTVPAGAPLRLYLTRRVSKRAGAPVEGKLMEPVFAFDREVVPAGSILAGQVSRIRPRPKWQRIQAIVNGDLTPPVDAEIEFNTLTLPGGRRLSVHTVDTAPLDSIYMEPAKSSRRKGSPANQN